MVIVFRRLHFVRVFSWSFSIHCNGDHGYDSEISDIGTSNIICIVGVWASWDWAGIEDGVRVETGLGTIYQFAFFSIAILLFFIGRYLAGKRLLIPNIRFITYLENTSYIPQSFQVPAGFHPPESF
jgi:hypothetical protein